MLSLRHPLRGKPVFRRFQGEGVEFFFNLTNPPQIFDAHLLENTLPDLIFQWVFFEDHVLSQMVLKLVRTNEIE